MVMADINAPFVPAPLSELLVQPSDPDARLCLESALDLIPQLFSETRAEGSALGSAVQAAQEILVHFAT
jgi:hypothetical protein